MDRHTEMTCSMALAQQRFNKNFVWERNLQSR